MKHISLAQARRIALHAQGFGVWNRDNHVSMQRMMQVIRRMGLLQIDSINVVVRSHYLPIFSRLGPYDQALVYKASHQKPRKLVEYWAHEASYIPAETHQLLQWRMDDWQSDAWKHVRAIAAEKPQLLDSVLETITSSGPLTATQVEAKLEHSNKAAKANWGWNWSDAKVALEALFWSGRITASSRNNQFQRLYDVPHKVLHKTHIPATPHERAAAIETLVDIAAKANGISSFESLRDYFRLPLDDAKQAVENLIQQQMLLPVQVEGQAKLWYLHSLAKRPRNVTATALLSPFDPLVFDRKRIKALFNFEYKLEVYTPTAKRKYGYYVLPFLHNERLIARVDVKADRKNQQLLVQNIHFETGATKEDEIALKDELHLLAAWLDVTKVNYSAINKNKN